MIGTCALCGFTTDLVKSHVIPKFIFRKIKEGKGSYHQISPNPATPRRKRQTELQEPIFCRHCDTVTLRVGEAYLANVLFEKGRLHNVERPGPLNLSGLDYGKVQRCLLSLLWRMSLSHNNYFSLVQLSSNHSTRIRICILESGTFSELGRRHSGLF